MKGIRYSPHPPEAYSRIDGKGERFGVGLEFADEQYLQWWNLYWLSEPAVDNLLLPEDEWPAAPTCGLDTPMATAEALSQKLGGVPLEVLLARPASVFVDRLKACPHEHLEPYKLLGSEWVSTVIDRAALAQPVGDAQPATASAAKIVNPRHVVITEGNVLRVNFALRDQTSRKSEGGMNMYCPGCDKISPCKAVPVPQVTNDSSDYAQRQAYAEHPDIQFFQRGRKCLECGHKFVSAEVEWGFLEELVELRHALNSIKANAERYIKESAAASSSLADLSESLGVLRALKIYKGAAE